MAPFNTLLIKKYGLSAAAIPNWLALSQPVQVLVDAPDANEGEATSRLGSSPASRSRNTSLHQARSWQ
jgi:hypothetical protein